jgi:hypothetical protein
MISRRTRVCAGGSLNTRLVVFVQQRIAVFRREFLFLVGGEKFCVLVDADQVVVAGQEIAAVGQ